MPLSTLPAKMVGLKLVTAARPDSDSGEARLRLSWDHYAHHRRARIAVVEIDNATCLLADSLWRPEEQQSRRNEEEALLSDDRRAPGRPEGEPERVGIIPRAPAPVEGLVNGPRQAR